VPMDRLRVEAVNGAPRAGSPGTGDLVLVVVGVRPDNSLAVSAGARSARRARDRRRKPAADQAAEVLRRGGLRGHLSPAAGRDYLTLGTTPTSRPASPGRTLAAADNRESKAASAPRSVKIFDQHAARTAARYEAAAAGFGPGHRRPRGRRPQGYYPAHATASTCAYRRRATRQALGVSCSGTKNAEVAKSVESPDSTRSSRHDRR